MLRLPTSSAARGVELRRSTRWVRVMKVWPRIRRVESGEDDDDIKRCRSIRYVT
jgi:hypothetical protein